MSLQRLSMLFLPLALAAGCTADNGGGGNAFLRLDVTDAPVDGAQAVVVKFTGLELMRESGGPLVITFPSPRPVDLLTQGGTPAATIFDDPFPIGTYTQFRMLVQADGDAANSYITMADGRRLGLRLPSGGEGGLRQAAPMQAKAGDSFRYLADFDLRKSVSCPPAEGNVCLLRPAVRLISDVGTGGIQGVVSASRVPEDCASAVYLYAGNVAQPQDYHDAGGVQPIASKLTDPTQINGGYAYQFFKLAEGTYTLAHTCRTDKDDAASRDAEVVFGDVITGITVTGGQATTTNIPASP